MIPAHGMFKADDVAVGARRAAGAAAGGAAAGGGARTGGGADCVEIFRPGAGGVDAAWGTVITVLHVGQLI